MSPPTHSLLHLPWRSLVGDTVSDMVSDIAAPASGLAMTCSIAGGCGSSWGTVMVTCVDLQGQFVAGWLAG